LIRTFKDAFPVGVLLQSRASPRSPRKANTVHFYDKEVVTHVNINVNNGPNVKIPENRTDHITNNGPLNKCPDEKYMPTPSQLYCAQVKLVQDRLPGFNPTRDMIDMEVFRNPLPLPLTSPSVLLLFCKLLY